MYDDTIQYQNFNLMIKIYTELKIISSYSSVNTQRENISVNASIK